MKMKKLHPGLLVVLVSVLAFAECSDSGKRQTIVDKENTVSKEEPPSDEGKAVFFTCLACHGAGGEGMKSLNAPAIVNQETWYLQRQLLNFKEGIRGSDSTDEIATQMATIAKTLDKKRIEQVVKYLKTLPPTQPKQTLEGDVENGRKHYNMICGACHGANAAGNKALNSPKLTGVDDWYLLRQFNLFKEGKRGSHPDDTFGAQMKVISNSLPDEQTAKDVVAFIQSLEE